LSKLRNRLRDATRRRPDAIGFAAARGSTAHPRQVLVIVEVADEPAAAAAIAAGADALVFTGAPAAVAPIVAAAGSAPVGVRIGAATAADTAALATTGADFLVCGDEQTSAAALLDHRLGYVLAAADRSDDGLRLLRPLLLDAVALPAPPAELTLREQLRIRRLADLARKPVLALADAPVSAVALELWRDAGVLGVIASGLAPDALAALVAAAGAVPPPRAPTDRGEAIVPALPQQPGDDDDEDRL
jgi:hypothetical protein